MHTLLTHLEIYDDPRQGTGWLYPEELRLVERLGETLQGLVSDAPCGQRGAHALGHVDWIDARGVAMELKRMIEANGVRTEMAAQRPTPA